MSSNTNVGVDYLECADIYCKIDVGFILLYKIPKNVLVKTAIVCNPTQIYGVSILQSLSFFTSLIICV